MPLTRCTTYPRHTLIRPTPLLLRKIILRIVVLVSLLCLFIGFQVVRWASQDPPPAPGLVFVKYCMIPLAFVLHHMLRVWPWRYWLVICELVWSSMEIVGIGYMLKYNVEMKDTFVKGVDVSVTLLGCFWLTLAASCSISFFCLLWDIITHKGTTLLHQYDFVRGCCPKQSSKRWSLVFGRFTLSNRFSTDNLLIRGIRGGVAILCLLAMLGVSFHVLIGQPVAERGISTFKEYRDDGYRFRSRRINAFIALPIKQAPSNETEEDMLLSAADATVLISERNRYKPNCTKEWERDNGFIILSCKWVRLLLRSGLAENDPYLFTEVDVVISVNFSRIPQGTGVDAQDPFGFSKTIVYFGLDRNIDDITWNTRPIHLIPGSQNYGICEFFAIEKFKNPFVAAIGMPQYSGMKLVDVHSLVPDTRLPTPVENNTATLRVSMRQARRFSPGTKVLREYSERSILSGLAFAGGVWTFVNGLFAAIFGSTLLLVLFGVKPLSIYGLIHFFQRQRGSLVDRGYVLSAEEQSRTVAILREHLLDVEDVEANQQSRLDCVSVEEANSQGYGREYSDSEALMTEVTGRR